MRNLPGQGDSHSAKGTTSEKKAVDQLVTINSWEINTPVSHTDPGEYNNSIHYTEIVIPGDLPQWGGSRGIIYF